MLVVEVGCFGSIKQIQIVCLLTKAEVKQRQGQQSKKSGLRTIEVKPDLIADFTEMPFENETFAMVVFDPPTKTQKPLGKIVGWLKSMEDYLK